MGSSDAPLGTVWNLIGTDELQSNEAFTLTLSQELSRVADSYFLIIILDGSLYLGAFKTRCRSVQGKTYRIQNRRFSRSGFTCYQKQFRAGQLRRFEVDIRIFYRCYIMNLKSLYLHS